MTLFQYLKKFTSFSFAVATSSRQGWSLPAKRTLSLCRTLLTLSSSLISSQLPERQQWQSQWSDETWNTDLVWWLGRWERPHRHSWRPWWQSPVYHRDTRTSLTGSTTSRPWLILNVVMRRVIVTWSYPGRSIEDTSWRLLVTSLLTYHPPGQW